MKAYILVFLFSVAFAKEFSLKDPSNNKTCAMLKLSGKMTLTATKDGKQVGNVEPSFDDANLADDSTCLLMKLNMNNAVQTQFNFTRPANSTDMWQVTAIAQFNPIDVFGAPNVTFNGSVEAAAPPLESFPDNTSYLCNAQVSLPFANETPGNYTISITADVSQFQIQSTDSEKFAPKGTECSQDTSTTSTAATTTTSQTTASTTKKPSTPEYACKDKNDIRIRLVGNIALKIDYNTTEGKTQTAYFEVPANANTSGSNCEGNNTESLVLKFFEAWTITFDFATPEKTLLGADKSVSFYVTNITVNYMYDSRFKNASDQGKSARAEFADLGKNYLKASNKGYYSCKSNTSITAENVKMSTKNFKYTAFSTNNATLSGDVSECSADEDSSSVVPIAVGAALAGLVVIVLIAYLIGRKRSRKSGYESV